MLEVGCSNGHLSFHLAQRAEELVCIDVSERAVQLASARLQEFEHVVVENIKIPEDYSIQKFDLILIVRWPITYRQMNCISLLKS